MWYRIKNKQTGEEQTVCSLDGLVPVDQDVNDKFDIAELSREWEEDDEYDWGARRLKPNNNRQKRREQHERRKELSVLTNLQLTELVLDFDKRLKALEILSKTQ